MKKVILLLLTLLLCVGLIAACGGDETTTLAPAGSSTPSTSGPAPTGDLAKAVEYLRTLYQGKAEATAADYDMAAVVTISGVTYTVTWTVNVTSGVTVVPHEDGKNVTIDVDEKAAADIAYTLTATVTAPDGQSAQISFNFKVPAFHVASYAEFAAAEDDSSVVVQGVVTGIIAKSRGNSNNCLYVQGADGGYYVYGLADDPVTGLKLEIGMEVRVTGIKDTYSGTLEITGATVEVVSTDKKTVTPVDYTDLYKNATALTDSKLVGVQAYLVTVKGVEITGQDASTGYYKFKLGNLESYIRISSSVCPLTSDEQAALIQTHTDHFGDTADVTGVICLYNNAFYLTPVSADAFTNFVVPERTDAQKVELEKGKLTLQDTFTAAGSVDVPVKGSTYEEVTIAWTSDNDALVSFADGKMTVVMPDNNTTVKVKVTATLTCGSTKDTLEFTLTLGNTPIEIPEGSMSVSDLLDVDEVKNLSPDTESDNNFTSKKYTVTGKVTKIGSTGSYYKNVYITDGTKEMLVYSIDMGEGVTGFAVGDIITVNGYIQNYKGTIEFAGKKDADGVYDNVLCTMVVKGSGSGSESGSGSGGGSTDVPEGEKLTLSFGNTDNLDLTQSNTDTSNGKQVWTQDGLTLTNTGNVNLEFATQGQVRLYKSSKTTITAQKAFTVLVFHCAVYGDKDYPSDLVNSIGTMAGVTVTKDGQDVIVTFATEQTTFVIESMAAQVRLDSIDAISGSGSNPGTGTGSGGTTDPSGGGQGGQGGTENPPAAEWNETAPTGTMSVSELLAAVKGLPEGRYTKYQYTVTGLVSEIGRFVSSAGLPYMQKVVLKQGENTVLLYMAVFGNNVASVAVGDTITVTGHLENRGGVIGFSANGIAYPTVNTVVTMADKLAAEKERLTLDDTVVGAITMTVPTAGSVYDDVSIAWVCESDLVSVQDGKLVFTVPTANTDVTVTATLTCGGESVEVSFTVTLVFPRSFMEQAVAAATLLAQGATSEKQYIVVGTVTRFDQGGEYSETYGNASFYLDYNGVEILVFRTKMEGVETVQVGDLLALRGNLQNYNGKYELTNAVRYAEMTSVADAVAAAQSGSTDKVTIYGEITKIDTAYSSSYKNITVTVSDGTGSIQCFRMAGGEELKTGDHILVTGNLTLYGSTPELNSGCTYIGDPTIAPVTVPSGTLTVSELLEAVKDLSNGAYTTNKATVKGIVTDAGTSSSGSSGTYYRNVYLSDGKETVLVYAVNLGDGVTSFAVGDTVTVTGYVTNYGGTIEFNTHNGEFVYITAVETGGTTEPDVGEKLTLSFATDANLDRAQSNTDASNGKQVWTKDGLTLTNTGNVNLEYATQGHVRMYKNSTTVITSETPFTALIFHSPGGSYSGYLKTSLSAVSGVTVTDDGLNNYTVTFSEATTTFTFTASAGQCRVTALDFVVGSTGGGTTDPGTGGDTPTTGYVKVTKSEDLTEGTYLIVREASASAAWVFTGVDAGKNYVEAVLSGNVIAPNDTVNALTVTIKKSGDGYTIVIDQGTNAGKYMTNTTTSNALKFNDSSDPLTITVNSDGTVSIQAPNQSTTLAWNNTSGDTNQRFRFYKNSTAAGSNYELPCLYKLVEG